MPQRSRLAPLLLAAMLALASGALCTPRVHGIAAMPAVALRLRRSQAALMSSAAAKPDPSEVRSSACKGQFLCLAHDAAHKSEIRRILALSYHAPAAPNEARQMLTEQMAHVHPAFKLLTEPCVCCLASSLAG